MDSRIQIVAILITGLLLLSVLELVRRRRMMERYALLWLFSAGVLLLLAVWRGLLEELAGRIGIFYAPSALFVVAFGFILLMLLHFSTVISGLTDQNKLLAQELGLLRQRVASLESRAASEHQAASEEPVAPHLTHSR